MAKGTLRDSGNNIVLPYDRATYLRALDAKQRNPFKIVAQRGGQENLLGCNSDIVIGGGSRGGSKAQPYDSHVMTPSGMRRMGDIVVGDTVSGLKGTQTVVRINEVGVVPVYRIDFSDGTSAECSEEHLWRVRTERDTDGKTECSEWDTWNFEEMKEYMDSCPEGERILAVPLCGSVALEKKGPESYLTNPYVIGTVLGDPSMRDLSFRDNFMFETRNAEIAEQYDRCRINASTRCHYVKGTKVYLVSCLTLACDLSDFGMKGLSRDLFFIPERLKTGNVKERLRLLQGMMDAGGYVQDGSVMFSTSSARLASDTAFVIRSLGRSAREETVDGMHVLTVGGTSLQELFKIGSKKSRCIGTACRTQTESKRITGYGYVGERKCRCLTVSNADGLYLTDDMTVTHNSFSLLLKPVYNIGNKNFRSQIFRREVNDLSELVDTSHNIFDDMGTYNRGKDDMTWHFDTGSTLGFNYYSDSYDDFKIRMQGKQYPFIGIDEITHIEYPKFKYLITCNRNAFHIRNQVWGTCNPDPESWVAKFIEYWIGEDGFPIRERDGVERFCFMDGDEVGDIYWGDSREEVYEKCRSIIDRYYTKEFHKFGKPEDLFVKSVTFVEARLSDNLQLMRSDPAYLANLAGQSEEQRERDLAGNWKFRTSGDDILKMLDMDRFYANTEHKGDGLKYASCDAAFDGGDNLVLIFWIGWHIQDIYVCGKNSRDTIITVKSKLEEWDIPEQRFTYDLNGIGQSFKGFFKDAVPFNNKESVEEKFKGIYGNMKSQCAYLLAEKIKNREVSIRAELLDRKYSGRGFSNLPLRQVLMNERKCIRAASKSGTDGFSLISKIDMKKLIGHSPDFIEAMLMRLIFEVKHKTKHIKGLGWL